MSTPVDKMTPDEYSVYECINFWDDEWTEEARAALNGLLARAWDEGLKMAGPLGFRAFSDLNPYQSDQPT